MPLLPTGIVISEMYHDDMETTVTLNWDIQEIVVDNYTVSISPTPPYQPENNVIFAPPWNVTVSHNQEYAVDITATNCLGSSGTAFLPNNISISKW